MIGATVSNALHDVSVTCTQDELSIIQPPSGKSQHSWVYLTYLGLTCGAYLGPFLESPDNVGQLLNPNATSNCEYCRYSQGDAYLATLNMYWSQRWRNFGIFMSYVLSLMLLIEDT
jgi:ABC-type multidrug transport system permease subunit